MKKALNFDLDTHKLQEYYSGNDWHNAYRDIQLFMEKNDFSHRQGSGYVSNNPMSKYAVTTLIYNLQKQIPWLSPCINKFDVTNIGQQFDLTGEFKNTYHELLFKEAISKCDYPKLMQLQSEGYTPSAAAIKGIMEDKSISNNTKIAVSKIFRLEEKEKNPLSNIKLATSGIIKGKDKTLEL